MYPQKKGINIFFGSLLTQADDGFSGKNFDRPDWKRLIGEIEAGNVDTVITEDMSRIGRDYLQTGNTNQQRTAVN